MGYLKIVQRSSFKAFKEIERFIPTGNNEIQILPIGDDPTDLPADWNPVDKGILYFIMIGVDKYPVFNDDQAYLLRDDFTTLRVIHKGK